MTAGSRRSCWRRPGCWLPGAQAQAQPQPRGHLVVVGGGGVPDAILTRALELAGGPAAPIVVFPQASELADTGDVAVEMWKKAGATNVRWMPLTDAAAARQAVESAAFIWFPGGDQIKLMKAFEGTGVPDVIARRYRDGAVVGRHQRRRGRDVGDHADRRRGPAEHHGGGHQDRRRDWACGPR